MRFDRLIEGKNIAIVGPAEYMMGSLLGKEIEQNEYFASKNLYTELSQLDARGTSLLAKEAFNRNTSLLNNIGSFAQAGNKSGLFGS